MAREEVLGEGLGAFELRGTRTGPEATQAGLPEFIDDTRDQRGLGTDDGQVDGVLAGEGEQGRNILGTDGDVLQTRLPGGSGVARSHPDLGHAGGLSRFPGQRVLAPAAADDQYLHGNASFVRIRKSGGLCKGRSGVSI